MSDGRAMPVSSNLSHARTSAIDAAAAAAAAANKLPVDVKRAYKHLGLKDIPRISVLRFPFWINPSDAAQLLARSVKASAPDVSHDVQR